MGERLDRLMKKNNLFNLSYEMLLKRKKRCFEGLLIKGVNGLIFLVVAIGFIYIEMDVASLMCLFGCMVQILSMFDDRRQMDWIDYVIRYRMDMEIKGEKE